MTDERKNPVSSAATNKMSAVTGSSRDEGRTLEEIISAVAEQEFAELPPVSMTPEKLKAMAAERKVAREVDREEAREAVQAADREEDRKEIRRKRRNKWIVGIAAMFVLVLIGAVAAFNALSVDVGADKNPKEEIKTEDGVVIEDGGYGASDGENSNSWSTDAWEEVEMAKATYPQLMIPEYIPEEYEFDSLCVEQLDTGDIIFEYLFTNINDEMLEIEGFVLKSGELSVDVNNISRTIKTSKQILYIQEKEMKKATIQIDDSSIIKVWSNIPDEQLIRVVDNLII